MDPLSQHTTGGMACGAEPQSSLHSLGRLLWAQGSATLVCTRQNAAPGGTLALRAPSSFLWARHSLCQAMTFPAAGTHAPVPHSGTHARAGQGGLGHRAAPSPGRGHTHRHGTALAHLSEHLNLPALYDGAIQLLPCPVGICASFKSYKPKTL